MSGDVSIERTPRAGLVLRCQRCDITEANLSNERLAQLCQQHDHESAPWRFDVPEVPAHVTCFRITDSLIGPAEIVRLGELWAQRFVGGGLGEARPISAWLACAPLVECPDPRAAS